MVDARDGSRTFRIVAMCFAVVALAVATLAGIVVIRRDPPQSAVAAQTATPAPGRTLEERVISAADAVRLRTLIALVSERNQPKGLRVTETELAGKLGLEPDDMVTAISGIPATNLSAISEALRELVTKGGDTLYVDFIHDAQPRVGRWRIEGYLPDALAAAGPATFHVRLPAPDPITRQNDFEYDVPRVIADQIVLDPAKTTGFRVALVSRNGKPFGFELSAIRAGSAYAKLGFRDGDIVHAVNGLPLTSERRARAIHEKLKAANEIAFGIERGGRLDQIVIRIR